MKKIQYTSLCHYPSLVSSDCITMAVLFYIEKDKKIVLEHIKNWKRLKAFNDDFDIDLIKLQLEGIQEELEEFVKEDRFVLSKYTKFYINEVKFQPIVEVEVENIENFIEECKRQYLIGDISKEKRPSVDEQIKFIKNYLKKSDLKYKGNIDGYFDEKIDFDFQVNNYLFKSFSIKGKNEKRMIHSVKEWAYDAYKLQDKYNIIFVTDIDEDSYDKYRKVMNILKEESESVISTDELFDYIINKTINQTTLY